MTVKSIECIHLLLKEKMQEAKLALNEAVQRKKKYEAEEKSEGWIKAVNESIKICDDKYKAIERALAEFEFEKEDW